MSAPWPTEALRLLAARIDRHLLAIADETPPGQVAAELGILPRQLRRVRAGQATAAYTERVARGLGWVPRGGGDGR